MSLTATHNQNISINADPDVDNIRITLPTLQASMERIFPFAKREGIKKGIIDNLNFQYSFRGENRLTTNDDDFLTGRMFDNAQVGGRSTIPLSTNFKVAKYFSVTVGGNYQDTFTLQTFDRGLDPDNPDSNTEVVLDTINGFDRFNTYNLNASIGTTVYGTFNFGEKSKIQAIRHTMRPSIGWGYTPSFERFFDSFTDLNGDEVLFSRFEGTLNGAPSLNSSNTASFSLQNTLEAKVKDKDSTVTELKKITLLSNFNLSTSYNFQADSLKLAPIGFNGGTTILNNKLNINFSGTLDPYTIDNNGTRINTFNIANGGSLLRLTRASANFSYSLSNETFKKKEKDGKGEDLDENNDEYRARSGGRTDDLFGFGLNDDTYNKTSSQNQGDIENPIYGTIIPWDVRMQFTTSYINNNRQNEFATASLMFSGNITPSPRWSVRVASGYDFVGKGFAQTQLGFQRNLKSFDLRFNWVPFGRNERWDFFIGISSSILSDLKYDARSQIPQ